MPIDKELIKGKIRSKEDIPLKTITDIVAYKISESPKNMGPESNFLAAVESVAQYVSGNFKDMDSFKNQLSRLDNETESINQFADTVFNYYQDKQLPSQEKQLLSFKIVNYLRFSLFHRFCHFLIIISFFGLVLTGMPLAFRGYGWASWLYELFGGYPTAGYIHRICALITFFAAFTHFIYLFYSISVQKKKGFFWGPNSMLIQPRDIFDIIGDLKWFLGIGKRPNFDRWIYWEKFEYLSLMWGTLVMAITGLILWFPVQFTKIIPVSVAGIIDLPSIALIVHRYEAILAAGFIFTIHFFHTHLLPEKMPVDEAIFTGRITEEEFKHERLNQYKRLERQRQLDNYKIAPPSLFVSFLTRLFAVPILITGLIMVGLMFSALLVWAI